MKIETSVFHTPSDTYTVVCRFKDKQGRECKQFVGDMKNPKECEIVKDCLDQLFRFYGEST